VFTQRLVASTVSQRRLLSRSISWRRLIVLASLFGFPIHLQPALRRLWTLSRISRFRPTFLPVRRAPRWGEEQSARSVSRIPGRGSGKESGGRSHRSCSQVFVGDEEFVEGVRRRAKTAATMPGHSLKRIVAAVSKASGVKEDDLQRCGFWPSGAANIVAAQPCIYASLIII
jgi:hypothetical protein